MSENQTITRRPDVDVIRVERIVENATIRFSSASRRTAVLLTFFIFVMIVTGRLGFIEGFMTLMVLMVIFVLPWLMFSIGKDRKRKLKSAEATARQAFPRFIGSNPQHMDLAVTSVKLASRTVNASGLAYADGRLFALEFGLAAEIPWSRVRSWTWNVDGYTQEVLRGGTFHENVAVGGANHRARAEAFFNSGFTLMTKDIEKPEWKFVTTDDVVLKRWMEILNQMNSGDLAAR